jgi:3-oxoacyl-[acyl-carrier protein] reductase
MTKKVALITGITGGLGRIVAIEMAKNGYSIAGQYLHQNENIAELTNQIKSLGVEIKTYQVQLKNEGEIKTFTESVHADFGQIDALIHLAGVSHSSISWKQEKEAWEDVISVNLTAPMLVSKAVIPLMKKSGSGTIIYTSSIVAHRPLAGTGAYAASKAGIEGLTRVQAIELGKSGITVNCIAPGYFNAGMINTVDKNQQQQLIENIPVGRLGNPEELAECILYLCSKGGKYVTGQIFHNNGGLYI